MFPRPDCDYDVNDLVAARPRSGGWTRASPRRTPPRWIAEGDDDECVLGVVSVASVRLSRLTSIWRDALRLCRGGDH